MQTALAIRVIEAAEDPGDVSSCASRTDRGDRETICVMDRFAVWGVMCLLVGCGFLASALRIYLQRRRFLASAEAAAGTVVEVHVRGVGRNRVSVPVLAFRTAGGTVQRAESLMGSGFRGFAVGETVAVRYDPADPSRAEVDSFAVLWGLALLRTGFAALFLLMGTIGLVVS